MPTENDQVQDLNLAALRETLAGERGKDYWRSLEDAAGKPEFQAMLAQEFPGQAYVWNQPLTRRELLRLTGATLAMAGLVACKTQPMEKIVPYQKQPEEIIPGKPLFFATAMVLNGAAQGLLVESQMGRPIKVEGNPSHPENMGATDAYAQSSILNLYDPDRSQAVIHNGKSGTWEGFLSALGSILAVQAASGGAGFRLLTQSINSPLLASQISGFMRDYPQAKWHQYEPVSRDNALAGARMAWGEAANTVYRFDKADVILSLDADFLMDLPGHLRYTRDFSNARRVTSGRKEMNRLYVVESSPSLTGTMADHRLPLSPSRIEAFARAVARSFELGPTGGDEDAGAPFAKWLEPVVKDLKRHPGQSIVVAGSSQPPAVHALAHAINIQLGNIGRTVIATEPIEAQPTDHAKSIADLAADMRAGAVEALVILGGNPMYDAPADLGFGELLLKTDFTAHLSPYNNETSNSCHWHIPEAHFLETWSDARAYDGTVSIVQPLIEPLYGGKSVHDLMVSLRKEAGGSGLDLVKNYWKAQYKGGDFETFWRRTLHDGVMAGTAFPEKKVALKKNFLSGVESAAAGGIEVSFRPDPTVFDGRFVNNGWQQELHKPITNLTWDNVAMVSPAMAEKLGLADSHVIEVKVKERIVKAPAWITPGHADDTVTLFLGYGQKLAGRIGSDIGYNAYAVRPSDAMWIATGAQVTKSGGKVKLAATQHHHNMEGRDLMRTGTWEEYQKDPHFLTEGHEAPKEDETLYPKFWDAEYAWGMSIDLNACTGCNACVVACQSENNIPIVGKDQVSRGREMHWIRVDRYYKGSLDNPEVYHQPVPCMHCENAPCEPVCPVEATTHSPEGINEMTYNRCVGTKYCSNNCPYKVRRFNFYKYADEKTESLKLMHNPDVTVRSRGVMEKCTYCVQRVNEARIEAKKDGRLVADGEIKTACQQVCPAEAIVFGNIKDADSQVAKMKHQPLNYGLLVDLNTRPRTTYSAKLRNPNPELEA